MNLTQEQVIEAIRNGKSLKDFSEWKNNKEVVLEAVKQDGYSLFYASERLKDDKEVVLEAISKESWALGYASERLRDDKEVVLFAVKQFGHNLQYASKRLRGDKDVVMEAIKNYGKALWYASDRLRDDKEVVLEAVKKDGWSLKYASEKLRNDKGLVLEAIKKDGWYLEYASDRLKKELLPQVLKSLGYTGSLNPIEIVKDNGDYLCLLTTEEQNNKEIVLEAVKQNSKSMKYSSKEIQNKIGNSNPVQFLEQWIKEERVKELDSQLDKKEKMVKIKI